MNLETGYEKKDARKLSLESLFLAIVMIVGLSGIFGIFFPSDKGEKPEWRQSDARISVNYNPGRVGENGLGNGPLQGIGEPDTKVVSNGVTQ